MLFDHLMRVIAVVSGGKAKDDHYCKINLEKSIGHVYRAAFDAVDGAAISLRFSISSLLKRYPQDVLADVLPNYWQTCKYLNVATGKFADYRTKKDVGQELGVLFDSYSNDLEKLKK